MSRGEAYAVLLAKVQGAGVLHASGARGRELGLDEVLACEGLHILASPGTTIHRSVSHDARHAVVIGDLFSRNGGEVSLGTVPFDAEPAALPGHLLGSAWGDYVGVAHNPLTMTTSLFASPFGLRHFYRVETAELILYLSGLDLAERLLGRNFPIDADRLGALLCRPAFRGRETCLSGFEKLMPGTIDHIQASNCRTVTWWDPWSFSPGGRDPRSASQRQGDVLDSVMDAVAALRPLVGKPLLELSGGLDSSILAFSLRHAGIAFEAVNHVSTAADGDERHYARLAAQHVGADCHEVAFRLGEIALAPATRKLPNPGAHLLARHSEQLSIDVARAVGATSFLSGGGGDNVFCAIYSPTPAVDLLRAGGSWSEIYHALADVADITGAGLLETGRRFLRRIRQRDADIVWPPSPDFLSPKLKDARRPSHPWFKQADLLRPGKCVHVRSLVATQSAIDGHERPEQGGLYYPLLSQPVAEACLRIPTWEWVAQGQDRSVVRQAFRGYVPDALLDRARKGGLEGAIGQFYRMKRVELADWLLDGRLAGLGMLDRAEIEQYLAAKEVTSDMRYARLFELAGFESWARGASA